MSWFHKDHGGKVHPILKHADYTTILGAEVQAGRLAKLCYTGHASELSQKGVVQAIVPGGNLLWRTEFAEEYDVRDGHVAVAGGVVVTRVKDGKNHALLGHDLWTGAEKWRRPVGQMVSRLGVDGDALVFVTRDHVAHHVTIATGEDRPGEPVMTDQAVSSLVNGLPHPTAHWDRGSSSRDTPKDWSAVYAPVPGIQVYERDWAGSTEFGVGSSAHVHLVGTGSYEGGMLVGDVAVLAFKLDRDSDNDHRHHHWYLFTVDPIAQLGVLREDGSSEMLEGGKPWWAGKL